MKLFRILIIAFLFSALYGTSQSNENVTDSLGCKQGYWKELKDFDGKPVLLSEGNYLNGRKNGSWKEYYSSGKIKNVIEFKDGKPNGEYVTYYESGNINEKGTWKGNRNIGEHISYYESGVIKNKEVYNDKGRTGDQISYYESGKIKYKAVYNNMGKQNGPYLYYSEYGSVKGTGSYVDGKVSGIYTWYYDSGEIRELNYGDSIKVGFYKNGKFSDCERVNIFRITYYEESGLKHTVSHLKDGKANGEQLYYFDHEIISCKLQYENGIKTGPFSFYHENGKLKYSGAYKDGKMSGERICYDKDGNVVNGEYVFYQFDAKYVCNYINGKPEGEMRVYNSAGNISMSIGFQNGMPHGAHIYYYNNGKKHSQVDNYLNGEYVK